MIPRGTTFEFEYLGEFKIDIKNILGHESAAHMGLINEEKRRPKISCYCPLSPVGIIANNMQYEMCMQDEYKYSMVQYVV
jgi:hypothetical protein